MFQIVYGNYPGREYNVVREKRGGTRRELERTPSIRDGEDKSNPAKEIERVDSEVGRKMGKCTVLLK